MSRRDRAHVMTELARASGTTAGVGVPLADLERAIGRTGGDMRTALELQALAGDGLIHETTAGVWALTDEGVAQLREDEELSGR